MVHINRLFTPSVHTSILSSSLLLAVRIVFGLLFLNHGIEKWIAFGDMAMAFPDPLGVGNSISLLLVLFAEILCSIAFIIGLLFRLALLPMIFTMIMAVFVIHSGDPIEVREPAIIYLTMFVVMFISGPGKFSVDATIQRYLQAKKLVNPTL